MSNRRIVHLGTIRELLAEWQKVRVELLAGRLAGFHVTLRAAAGEETIFLAGVYRDDPMEAMDGILNAAADSTDSEYGEPPSFRASRL